MKRAAVIAGVNRYDRDPSIRPLLYSDADCTELHGFLKHQARYDAVQLVREPSKHDILDAVEEAVSGLEAGDLLVFFFAGHGIEYAGKHLLLCRPARLAWLKHYDEAIPVDHLRDLTAKPGLSRVLILDSCRSDLMQTRGAGSAGLTGEANLRDVVTQLTAPVEEEGSLTILCSCAEGKQALELPQRKQGLFTAALLELMQESLNQETELSISDAFQQTLAERMTAIAKTTGHPWEQRPWVQRSGPVSVLVPASVTRGTRAPAAVTTTFPQTKPSAVTSTPEQDLGNDKLKQRILVHRASNDNELCNRSLSSGRNRMRDVLRPLVMNPPVWAVVLVVLFTLGFPPFGMLYVWSRRAWPRWKKCVFAAVIVVYWGFFLGNTRR